MDAEKYLEDVAVPDNRGIEFNPHDLGMAGVAPAHLFVGGIGNATTHVTRFDALDPTQFFEDRLKAPETAARENGELG